MFNTLKNKKVISVYSPEEFPVIDNENLSEEFDVVAAARKLAKKELPESSAQNIDANEVNFRSKLTTQLMQKSHKVQQTLNNIGNEINNLSIQQQISDANSAPEVFRKTSYSELETLKEELVGLKKKVDVADEDLEQFKSKNKLNREADYPLSQFKTYGVLFLFLIIESILNGFFFAEGSDSGLLGGITIAGMVAFVNVSFGFMIGKFIVPFKNHIRTWKSNLSLVISILVGVTFIFGNLLIAHFREALSIDPDNAKQYVLESLAGGMFNITDLHSWLLFAVGIIFYALAMEKGYKSDDSYPGYGKFARLKYLAENELQEVKEEAQDLINDFYEEAVSFLDDNYEIIKRNNKSLANSISSFETQKTIFENYKRHIQGALNYITALYRDTNKAERSTPAPSYFDSECDFEFDIEPLKFKCADKRSELINAKEELEKTLPHIKQELAEIKNGLQDKIVEVTR